MRPANAGAEPVKSQPATYTLSAVTPTDGQLAQLRTAKRVALPGRSIVAVPVELVGQCTKAAIQLAAPKQRFGEYLIIPEGL